MFKSLLKAAVGVVVTPLAVAADVVTLGGALTEQEKPYTVQTLGSVVDNVTDAITPE